MQALFTTRRELAKSLERELPRLYAETNLLFHACDCLHGQQRVPAKVEEVVVDAHTVDPEYLSPYVSQLLLDHIARCL